jgi:hypothetical protein
MPVRRGLKCVGQGKDPGFGEVRARDAKAYGQTRLAESAGNRDGGRPIEIEECRVAVALGIMGSRMRIVIQHVL